jgi:ATP-dependent Clp protease, protease subunit
VANSVIAQLLFLQMQDPKKDIHIYINSPGGSVTAGLAMYDTMQFLTCDVNTYCIGIAASMGSVLLTAGTKGKRFCLPNSHVMIHQVSGGAQGTASDVERTIGFMFNLKKRLNGILAKHTGKTVEEVEHDSDRDNYMTAEESVAYGLVDKVLESRKQLPTPSPPSRKNSRTSNSGVIHFSISAFKFPTIHHGPRFQSDDVLLLRKEPLGGQKTHRRPRRLYLQRVHRSLLEHP